MHSPLARCLLALILLFGQSAGVLHALEHLVPPADAGSTAADEHAPHRGSGAAMPDETTASPIHADGERCTLCLSLGAGQAPARPADAWRPPAALVRVGGPIASRTFSGARAHVRPPSRGPPILS